MLGNEQDCYGSCTDLGQAYNGMMDEARARCCQQHSAAIARAMMAYCCS
jgi:hypothetical protein